MTSSYDSRNNWAEERRRERQKVFPPERGTIARREENLDLSGSVDVTVLAPALAFLFALG